MKQFITDIVKRRVLQVSSGHAGDLVLSTRICIRGDYQNKPVRVTVDYETRFIPDASYGKVDPRYPDEDPDTPNFLGTFKSEEERLFAIKLKYTTIEK